MATLTSCCSTDSERPHRCCHLPNSFGSCRIFPVLHNGREMPPRKIAPSPGEIRAPNLKHDSTRVHIPRRHFDLFIRFSTARACVRCDLKTSMAVFMATISWQSLCESSWRSGSLLPPIGERSIVMSVSVCVFACLRSYHVSDLHHFLCMLAVAVARSSSGA